MKLCSHAAAKTSGAAHVLLICCPSSRSADQLHYTVRSTPAAASIPFFHSICWFRHKAILCGIFTIADRCCLSCAARTRDLGCESPSPASKRVQRFKSIFKIVCVNTLASKHRVQGAGQ
jgi:hypothetical protein